MAECLPGQSKDTRIESLELQVDQLLRDNADYRVWVVTHRCPKCDHLVKNGYCCHHCHYGG